MPQLPVRPPPPSPRDPKRTAQWLLVGLLAVIAGLIVLLYKLERHYGLKILFKH